MRRRLIYLILLAVFVGASVSCVSASTDCERWFVAYRQQLAHSRQLQRVAAVRRRAKLYAKRKLAGYVKPAPKPHPAVTHGPRMTPRQTMRHLDLACGVLPEGEQDTPRIAEETPGDFRTELPLSDGVDLLPAAVGDMVAENTPPVPPFAQGAAYSPAEGGPSLYLPPVGGFGPGGGGYAPSGGGSQVPSNGGSSIPTGGGTFTPPGGGTIPPNEGTSLPPGGGTTFPPVPPGPPQILPPPTPPSGPIVPPVAVVPEPAPFVLLLTGVLGAAGAIRRRLHA